MTPFPTAQPLTRGCVSVARLLDADADADQLVGFGLGPAARGRAAHQAGYGQRDLVAPADGFEGDPSAPIGLPCCGGWR